MALIGLVWIPGALTRSVKRGTTFQVGDLFGIKGEEFVGVFPVGITGSVGETLEVNHFCPCCNGEWTGDVAFGVVICCFDGWETIGPEGFNQGSGLFDVSQAICCTFSLNVFVKSDFTRETREATVCEKGLATDAFNESFILSIQEVDFILFI